MASATPQGTTDSAPLQLLPWCSALLLVLYGVGVVNTIVPLQLTSPQWQVHFCEALINQSPLLLMALSVAVLGQRVLQESITLRRILSWSRRAALPLTLGFALLIPLQGMASLQLLQNANSSTNAVIKESERRVASSRLSPAPSVSSRAWDRAVCATSRLRAVAWIQRWGCHRMPSITLSCLQPKTTDQIPKQTPSLNICAAMPQIRPTSSKGNCRGDEAHPCQPT